MKRFLPAVSGYAPIQRLENQTPKIYHAPEWNLNKSGKRDEKPENYSPMHNYGKNYPHDIVFFYDLFRHDPREMGIYEQCDLASKLLCARSWRAKEEGSLPL